MNEINIDLNEISGRMKPLHGVNCAPYNLRSGSNQTLINKYFKEAGIPYSRLHDVMYPYGSGYYIDVPNIFKDFSKDENDESSYDFYYSDEYIKAIIETGAQIVYRLGISIEWGSKKYTANPPQDFLKWAKICEHIIMHYNEGWANGFRFQIEYWEIWNEPENPPMWTGTKEQFFDLYKTSAIYLKSRFPDIKIGGYGSCGFYAITRENSDDFHKSFVSYFTDFLQFIKENNVPLDFYMWHIYSQSVNETIIHAKYVREMLDRNGYGRTEAHLNEWNFGNEGGGFRLMRTMVGASYITGVLCSLQNCDFVDKAMYYDFSLTSMYDGFIDQNDSAITCTYYSFVAFNELFKLQNHIKTKCNVDGIYVTCAANSNEGAILISNYSNDSEAVSLNIRGIYANSKISYHILSEKQFLEKMEEETISNDTYNKMLKLPNHSVLLVKISR